VKSIMEDCLRRFLDKGDRMTYEHSLRVGHLARIVAAHVSGWTEEEKEAFVAGCCIHDIGKRMIPLEILHKPTVLTSEEWRSMRRHPEIGMRLLHINGYMHPPVADIVQYHHERWDGLGYPHGLKGSEIPEWARVCSVIDAFDTIVSNRPYRRGLSVEQAKEELRRQSGTQFDPDAVELFLNVPFESFRAATEFCETYPFPGSSRWKRNLETNVHEAQMNATAWRRSGQ